MFHVGLVLVNGPQEFAEIDMLRKVKEQFARRLMCMDRRSKSSLRRLNSPHCHYQPIMRAPATVVGCATSVANHRPVSETRDGRLLVCCCRSSCQYMVSMAQDDKLTVKEKTLTSVRGDGTQAVPRLPVRRMIRLLTF